MNDPSGGPSDAAKAGPHTDMAKDQAPGMPRWVKIFAAVAIAVVLIVVVALIAGGGEHGPQRHRPGGSPHTSPADKLL